MSREAAKQQAADELERWEKQLADELTRLFERQEAVVLARLQGVKARKNTRHWHPPGEQKVDPTYVLDPNRWVLDAAGSVEPVVRRLHTDTFDGVATGLAAQPAAQQATSAPAEPAEPTAASTAPPPLTEAAVAAAANAWGGGGGNNEHGAALLSAYVLLKALTGPDLTDRRGALAAMRARASDRLEQGIQGSLAIVGAAAQAAAARVQQVISEAETAGDPMSAIVDSVKATYEAQRPSWVRRAVSAIVPPAVNNSSQLGATEVGDLLTQAVEESSPEPLATVPHIFKQWLSQRDEKVRPTHVHADGQVRPLQDPFELGGFDDHPIAHLMFPADPTGPIGEIANCRCTMLFSTRSVPAGEQKMWNPLQPRAKDGKWSRLPGLGALRKDEQGRDTDVRSFGLRYNPRNAGRLDVRAARRLDWRKVPLTSYPTSGTQLQATEPTVASHPIRKVLGGEPLRKGYDPQILRTDDGDFLIDGHHRVPMHIGLGHKTMPARLFDGRGGRLEQAVAEADEARAAADDAAAQTIAEQKVALAAKNEPTITPLIAAAVDEHGGHLEGLDQRLKTVDSTKRKILLRARMKQTSPAGAASGVSDVLRYTGVLPTDGYMRGVNATVKALGAAGFHPTISNNYWPKGDAYSGLNMLFSGHGQSLEVQFHTPESLHAKTLAHLDYEVSRDDSRPLLERQAAWDRMVGLWDAVPQPPDWWSLGSLFIYDAPGKGTGRGRYVSAAEARANA